METTPFETPADASDAEPPAADGPTPSVGAAIELADAVSGYQRRGADRWRTLIDAISVMAIAFGAVGIFVLGMFVHSRMSGDGTSTAAPVAQAQVATTAPANASGRVDVSADDDPARGPEDARVTVIEFADFQCPYCGRFHAQTLPLILRDYGDRIRFVYRDFPLTASHPYAEKASEAGECAHEQGKFWQYHDVLYLNQTALDRASLSRYAQNVGLDTAAFDSCVDSSKYATEVANDLQAGSAAGVRGTPAFFVNGQLISGAQPYSVFKTAIDAALANAQ
ncbi:MAG: DsbA family protein [Dehalococcoidia bacterium]|nr:MAG: DsbA family protein [Dehalococcoidia bacterium]